MAAVASLPEKEKRNGGEEEPGNKMSRTRQRRVVAVRFKQSSKPLLPVADASGWLLFSPVPLLLFCI